MSCLEESAAETGSWHSEVTSSLTVHVVLMQVREGRYKLVQEQVQGAVCWSEGGQ